MILSRQKIIFLIYVFYLIILYLGTEGVNDYEILYRDALKNTPFVS